MRALKSLGLVLPNAEVCSWARGRTDVRPKRCPGCGEPVVDPRGLALDAIAERLGTMRGWAIRNDGLIALRDCPPAAIARRRRRSIAAVASIGTVLAVAVSLVLLLRPPPAIVVASLSLPEREPHRIVEVQPMRRQPVHHCYFPHLARAPLIHAR